MLETLRSNLGIVSWKIKILLCKKGGRPNQKRESHRVLDYELDKKGKE